MGYVYKIVNNINGKVYIGKTQKSVDKRYKEHLRALKRSICEKRPLYSAMKKYGLEHFHIEVLEKCCDEILSDREKYWIEYYDSYKSGYNATIGGDGVAFINKSRVLELYEQYKNCKRVAQIMGICLESVRDILHKNGIHIFHSGYHSRHNVIMIDKTTNEKIKKFKSYADAARWLICNGKSNCKENGLRSHIADVCNGKRKTVAGYKWRYVANAS